MKKIIAFFLTIFILIWSINCYLGRKKYLKYIGRNVYNHYDINVNKIYDYEIYVKCFVDEILNQWDHIWKLCYKYNISSYEKFYVNELHFKLNNFLVVINDMDDVLVPKGAEFISERLSKIQVIFKEIVDSLSYSIDIKQELEMGKILKKYEICYIDILSLSKLLNQPIYYEV